MDSKLRSPPARPGIVARTALVEQLLASPAPFICVVAPPGYGKTTLLGQWSGRLGTQVGWVSVDRRDNDPVVLLTYIAAALDRLEPVDPELVPGPRLARGLGGRHGRAPGWWRRSRR